MKRALVLALVLIPFTAFSVEVVLGQGFSGLLSLLRREPWAQQLTLDLVIALTLFSCWMFPDARRRGVSPWPYFAGILALGSIGALGYLIHRSLVDHGDAHSTT